MIRSYRIDAPLPLFRDGQRTDAPRVERLGVIEQIELDRDRVQALSNGLRISQTEAANRLNGRPAAPNGYRRDTGLIDRMRQDAEIQRALADRLERGARGRLRP